MCDEQVAHAGPAELEDLAHLCLQPVHDVSGRRSCMLGIGQLAPLDTSRARRQDVGLGEDLHEVFQRGGVILTEKVGDLGPVATKPPNPVEHIVLFVTEEALHRSRGELLRRGQEFTSPRQERGVAHGLLSWFRRVLRCFLDRGRNPGGILLARRIRRRNGFEHCDVGPFRGGRARTLTGRATRGDIQRAGVRRGVLGPDAFEQVVHRGDRLVILRICHIQICLIQIRVIQIRVIQACLIQVRHTQVAGALFVLTGVSVQRRWGGLVRIGQ